MGFKPVFRPRKLGRLKGPTKTYGLLICLAWAPILEALGRSTGAVRGPSGGLHRAYPEGSGTSHQTKATKLET